MTPPDRAYLAVPAAIRADTAAGNPDQAAETALAWWPTAHRIADPDWRNDLADAGEQAAIEAQNPPLLLALLDAGARAALRHRDHPIAEQQWARLQSLLWHHSDHPDLRPHRPLSTVVEIRRGYNFLRWGRYHRAMDELNAAAATLARTDDRVGETRARWLFGITMRLADREDRMSTDLSTAANLATPYRHGWTATDRAGLLLDLAATQPPRQARRTLDAALALSLHDDTDPNPHLTTSIRTALRNVATGHPHAAQARIDRPYRTARHLLRAPLLPSGRDNREHETGVRRR